MTVTLHEFKHTTIAPCLLCGGVLYVSSPSLHETNLEVEKVTCDLCSADVTEEPYEIASCRLIVKEGSRYEEGPSGTIQQYDFCACCFENELKPWLESRGAKPQERDIDSWKDAW